MTELSTGTTVHLSVRPGASRGLVIIPDIGGLRPLFVDLCDRLADEHGWSVAAVEPWPGREDMEISDRMASVASLDDGRLLADLAEAAGLLEVEPVAVLGFCMGGMFALKAAASARFDRAVSFYGMVRLPEHWVSASVGQPLAAIEAGPTAPILFLAGTADPWVPEVDADALEATGAEVVLYPDADHGFVHDPSRPTHRADDAADAWRRVAAFLAVEG